MNDNLSRRWRAWGSNRSPRIIGLIGPSQGVHRVSARASTGAVPHSSAGSQSEFLTSLRRYSAFLGVPRTNSLEFLTKVARYFG